MEIPKRIRTFTLGPFLLSFGNLDWKVWWITPNPWQNMVNRCEFFRNPMEISKVKEVWDAKLTTLKTNMTKLENPKCSIGDYICIHGGFSRNRHVSFFLGGVGDGGTTNSESQQRMWNSEFSVCRSKASGEKKYATKINALWDDYNIKLWSKAQSST